MTFSTATVLTTEAWRQDVFNRWQLALEAELPRLKDLARGVVRPAMEQYAGADPPVLAAIEEGMVNTLLQLYLMAVQAVAVASAARVLAPLLDLAAEQASTALPAKPIGPEFDH
jgi:hypothetical protein